MGASVWQQRYFGPDLRMPVRLPRDQRRQQTTQEQTPLHPGWILDTLPRVSTKATPADLRRSARHGEDSQRSGRRADAGTRGRMRPATRGQVRLRSRRQTDLRERLTTRGSSRVSTLWASRGNSLRAIFLERREATAPEVARQNSLEHRRENRWGTDSPSHLQSGQRSRGLEHDWLQDSESAPENGLLCGLCPGLAGPDFAALPPVALRYLRDWPPAQPAGCVSGQRTALAGQRPVGSGLLPARQPGAEQAGASVGRKHYRWYRDPPPGLRREGRSTRRCGA